MSNTLWETCIENLSLFLSEDDIGMWLKPLEPMLEPDKLILYAPNKFVLDQVKKDFLQTIELVIKKLEPSYKVTIQLGTPKTLFDKPTREQTKQRKLFSSKLIPEFKFETFVEGSSNQIAASSAMGVAKNPNGSFNPLLIYGSTGLGKSHLMHAIGNYVKENDHKKIVVYQTCEQFVGEMVEAISNRNIDEFKKYYRSVDVLLVDDIQFLAGKDKSQEEFFHLFNSLLGSKSQVVLTCDRYPKDVDNLEERLKSRFGAGLSVAVEPPDLETRAAILKKKSSLVNFNLPDDVAFFIADKVNSHVRDLEGALNSVFAMSQFNGQPASIELVKVALRDILNSQSRQISIDNIQKAVALYYSIKITDLKAKSRKASLARPRQIAMAISKELTTLSLPEIGSSFERDHTTVIHAIKKIAELKKTDPRIREDYTNLVTRLTA